MKKRIIVSPLLCCVICLLSIGNLSAQQEEQKRVVIIKKIENSDGTSKLDTITAEGEEADALIKEMQLEEDIDIEIEKEVKSMEESGVKKKRIRKEIRKEISENVEINVEDDGRHTVVVMRDGFTKTLEWDGSGKMPKEIKKYMERAEMGGLKEKMIEDVKIIKEKEKGNKY